MVVLDTSVLVLSLCGSRRLAAPFGQLMASSQPVRITTWVLYEWLRGPRTQSELVTQEALLPAESALAFESADAEASAQIYRSLKQPRGREADIAIAACAIRCGAALWTADESGFRDIPGLILYRPG